MVQGVSRPACARKGLRWWGSPFLPQRGTVWFTEKHGFFPTTTAGLGTFSQGLVALPLQQCCPLPDPPYIVDCGVATGDPCWYQLSKVGSAAASFMMGGKDQAAKKGGHAEWA